MLSRYASYKLGTVFFFVSLSLSLSPSLLPPSLWGSLCLLRYVVVCVVRCLSVRCYVCMRCLRMHIHATVASLCARGKECFRRIDSKVASIICLPLSKFLRRCTKTAAVSIRRVLAVCPRAWDATFLRGLGLFHKMSSSRRYSQELLSQRCQASPGMLWLEPELGHSMLSSLATRVHNCLVIPPSRPASPGYCVLIPNLLMHIETASLVRLLLKLELQVVGSLCLSLSRPCRC